MSAYQDYPIIGNITDGTYDVRLTQRTIDQLPVKVAGYVQEAQRILEEVDALRLEVVGCGAEVDAARDRERSALRTAEHFKTKVVELHAAVKTGIQRENALMNDLGVAPSQRSRSRSAVDSIAFALCENDECGEPDYGNDHMAEIVLRQLILDGHLPGTALTVERRVS